MFFLIALLVVALGAGTNYLFHATISSLGKLETVQSQSNHSKNLKGGSRFMENNPWLRYALYSFLGILLLMTVAGLLTPNQQTMYGHQQGQMTSGMNTGFDGNNMQMNRGMVVPVIMVPMNSMYMMGQMPSGNMGNMSQMPMNMQGGGMGMMSMPMGGMQGGNMGNMQNGSSSGGMGMMNMPMGGMQGGSMGNMQSGSSGGGMGMMNMPMGGMQGGGSMSNMQSGSSSGGGMGMM